MAHRKVISREGATNTLNLRSTKKSTGISIHPIRLKNDSDNDKTDRQEVERAEKMSEKHVAGYITQNENSSKLSKSHDCNASMASKLLHEVTSHNKKLMSIQAELEGNLDRKMKEMEDANKKWSRKFESLQQKNSQNVKEIIELRKLIEEKQGAEKNFVNSKMQLTAVLQEVKENEGKAKSEVESWKNVVSNLKADHKKEIAALQKENSDLIARLGLATQKKTSYREAKELECDKVKRELDKITREKKDIESRFNHLQHKLTATVQEAKKNDAKAKSEIESSENALSNANASHKIAIAAMQAKNRELSEKLALVSQERNEACASVGNAEWESQRTVEELNVLRKEKENLQSRFDHLHQQYTAMIQEAKQNETKAKMEIQSSRKALTNAEACHKEAIALINIKNKELAKNLALVSQQRDEACTKVTNMEYESRTIRQESETLTKEKQSLQVELNCLQQQVTALMKEAKHNEAEAKLEVESSRNALCEFEASHTETVALLRVKNQELTEKLSFVSQERDEARNMVASIECESRRTSEELEALRKAITTMKSTCSMQDEQISDLEGLNQQLTFHNEQIHEEKETALLEMRSLRKKLCDSENVILMKDTEMMKVKNDPEEMIQLRNQLLERTSQEQEALDQLANLERKYKLQEMHIDMLQKKLQDKKEDCDRLKQVMDSYEKRIRMLENVHSHATSKLTQQHQQIDGLSFEKTRLLNEVDDMKMNHSHEAIRFNSTIGQQSKLIDFLQARVESYENHDKKKKRRKLGDLYQVPLQYKELQEMLEESKQLNLQLQAKVNSLRTELQAALSEVNGFKHGLHGIEYMSSGETSISAFKMTATSHQQEHKGLHHCFVKNICTRSTQCRVCLDCVRFGSHAYRCSQCKSWCHLKCRDDANDICSRSVTKPYLKYKEKELASSSPVSCVAIKESEGNRNAWLKVLCDGQSWKRKWVQLQDGALILHKCEKTFLNLFKRSNDNEETVTLDLLQQQCYVHATVPSLELAATDSTVSDHLLVFKLELFSGPFLHTSATMYFLSSSLADKRKWVAAFQKFSTSGLTLKNAVSNLKVSGNKIVTLDAKNKLTINCSLPISKEKVLFGCDEGLHVLMPSSSFVCDHSHIVEMKGADRILQMEPIVLPNLIVAIEGEKKRLVSFDVSNLMSKSDHNNNFVKLCPIDCLVNCHLFAVGTVEGEPNICAATLSSVHIYRYNKESARFEKKRDIAVAEPCTCLQFTLCSVILGTSKFLEMELTNFKLDDFLNPSDQSLCRGTNAFPVAMIQIGETNGIYEYLLCYHEYGVFVDCFGSKTRSEEITWSRSPVSFAYRAPHLIITHLSSIEIMLIHKSRQRKTTHQVYIDMPNARYLGSAITDGAIYVSGDDSDKMSVYCCKGLLEPVTDREKSIDNLRSNKMVSISSDTIDEMKSETSEFSEYSEVSYSSAISSVYSPRKRKQASDV